MSNKYHLPLNEDVNLEHINDLITKKIREDDTIDYKQQTPKDISKAVCGFLNTFGGHIVLGIEEEKELPIKIIGFESEKITSLNQNIKDT
ncbi:unnamed protein product, partial [marine sediment metagenome]